MKKNKNILMEELIQNSTNVPWENGLSTFMEEALEVRDLRKKIFMILMVGSITFLTLFLVESVLVFYQAFFLSESNLIALTTFAVITATIGVLLMFACIRIACGAAK